MRLSMRAAATSAGSAFRARSATATASHSAASGSRRGAFRQYFRQSLLGEDLDRREGDRAALGDLPDGVVPGLVGHAPVPRGVLVVDERAVLGGGRALDAAVLGAA